MQHNETEKMMLEKVNEVGLSIGKSPEADFIFVVLAPYLDNLMALLKRLSPTEMEALFMKYEGVMKVMRMIENEAQKMEKEMGLR